MVDLPVVICREPLRNAGLDGFPLLWVNGDWLVVARFEVRRQLHRKVAQAEQVGQALVGELLRVSRGWILDESAVALGLRDELGKSWMHVRTGRYGKGRPFGRP